MPHFLRQKEKKMQFSLPVKIYSAPINPQEVTYTVSGTLLIDTNITMFRAFCAAYAMGGLTFLEAGNISLDKHWIIRELGGNLLKQR